MNTYRISDRNLVTDFDAVVGLKFDGQEEIVEAFLVDLPATLRAKGLRARMPRRVTINGMKGGAFPCLLVKTKTVAALMSGRCGYKVEAGDGLSFATQAAAGSFWVALRDLGADLKEMTFEWRIGSKVQKPVQLNLPKLDEPNFEGDAPWTDHKKRNTCTALMVIN